MARIELPHLILAAYAVAAVALLMFGRHRKPDPKQRTAPPPYSPARPSQTAIQKFMAEYEERVAVAHGREDWVNREAR